MEIENDKINYRRANIDDIDFLIDYRVRFLNELYNHPEDNETEILRKSLRKYFSEAIPSNDFMVQVGWFCCKYRQGMGDLNL